MNEKTQSEIIRMLLDSFAGPYYVAATETQRKRVIDHAMAVIDARCARPPSAPNPGSAEDQHLVSRDKSID